MTKRGLFVGLITLDLIYLTEQLPSPNQKQVALDYTMAAGGPATNAAITFSHLGHPTTLLGVLGQHPTQQLVRADLDRYQVAIADLCPSASHPLPTSSILVTQATGERAVISLNAVRTQATVNQIPPHTWDGVAVVLIDGHQMEVGQAIAQQARERGIPVVMDGGSWKPGLDKLLPWVDYAICSANFYPPGCTTLDAVVAYLKRMAIPHIAITQGDRPIYYNLEGQVGELAVPSVKVVDTLGAGDIFHGAFCHFIVQRHPFLDALHQAAQIAAFSCQFFGPRQWMTQSL